MSALASSNTGDLTTDSLTESLQKEFQSDFGELSGTDSWNYIGKNETYHISSNGNITIGKSILNYKIYGNSLLPEDYSRVEYIESTGTQYIDTGIVPNENYGFMVDLYIDVNIDTTSPSVKILGSSLNNEGGWGGPMLGSWAATEGGGMTWFSGSRGWINPNLIAYTRMQCYFINDIYSTSFNNLNLLKKKQTYNNICGSIYLFAIHSENGAYINTTSHLKIYEYRAYDNSKIVQDFIPCYRKSDNVIGMYDTVNNQFYTNQGTGTFLKGKDILSLSEGVGDKNDDGTYTIPIKITTASEEKTININVSQPLRKIGDFVDYIDLKNKKVVRYIEETGSDSEETYNVLNNPKEETIDIDNIPNFNDIVSIDVGTSVSPSKVETCY
jgi:hypothetical protein